MKACNIICVLFAAHSQIFVNSQQINFVRTPEERFFNLTDYDFSPNYIEVPTYQAETPMRIHYIDEGVNFESTVLLLHGEPSWSYLYRNMIPILANENRVVVPDFVGFGKSDKPIRQSDYSYLRHILWMKEFIFTLNLRNITLFAQDWGGLIGLRLVTDADIMERFDRVVIGNTGLPRGEGASPEFLAWVEFAQNDPAFNIGNVVQGGTTTFLSPDVFAAYNAPFPDESFKQGARAWPALVPIGPNYPQVPENIEAWNILSMFTRPFLTTFSDSDPITSGGEVPFQLLVPGAQNQPHVTIRNGGHFLQEDNGEEIAVIMLQFIDTTPKHHL